MTFPAVVIPLTATLNVVGPPVTVATRVPPAVLPAKERLAAGKVSGRLVEYYREVNRSSSSRIALTYCCLINSHARLGGINGNLEHSRWVPSDGSVPDRSRDAMRGIPYWGAPAVRVTKGLFQMPPPLAVVVPSEVDPSNSSTVLFASAPLPPILRFVLFVMLSVFETPVSSPVLR